MEAGGYFKKDTLFIVAHYGRFMAESQGFDNYNHLYDHRVIIEINGLTDLGCS